ncbi:GNAT family N-acetyltransferase [Paraglaciecola aquimarina]|uniref:GNAT family N-acetyltransferase n=1 Tax=Paraglaciecola algarum TaxID=3050085 RepID=A0ABS9DC04_9ALTE|nr:GNAT family N-acetyltransferase [Paraglaciecola sp. G1-23]MCF2949538.1 GNAT family N-acetyltransferase [Paraglaciecola sp. G1-23]
MQIKLDDLTHPKIALLLEEHLADMRATSPPDSVHALDLNNLRSTDITFWSIWSDAELLGCAAIKKLNNIHYEIKSMRTARIHVRKGVANRLLQHIIQFALDKSILRLSLETGSQDFFIPAHQLYLKYGFEYCEPFADYSPDPNSKFMTLQLKTLIK